MPVAALQYYMAAMWWFIYRPCSPCICCYFIYYNYRNSVRPSAFEIDGAFVIAFQQGGSKLILFPPVVNFFHSVLRLCQKKTRYVIFSLMVLLACFYSFVMQLFAVPALFVALK